MKKRANVHVPWTALTLLLMSLALAGCGSSNVQVGWVESRQPGTWRASYDTFDGIERTTFRAQEGQTISLDYGRTVEKGSLSLRLVAPDGESLWEKTYRQDGDESITLTAPQQGRYQLCVEGEGAGGSFDLSWRVAE